LASDVHAVISHFELDRPVLVGHSWGGQIVTVYPALFFDAAGVVAVDGWITDVRSDSNEDDWVWLEHEYAADDFFRLAGSLDDLERALDAVSRQYGNAAAAVARRQFDQRGDGTWAWRRSSRELLAVERAVDEQTAGTGTEIYAQSRCPILLVGGERSEFEREAEREGRFGRWGFSRAATRPITERFRHVRDLWLPCGHDIPHEMPAALAAIIRDFATSL
jgi:pimeloyl-ACP methyl ester carboxylesterase